MPNGVQATFVTRWADQYAPCGLSSAESRAVMAQYSKGMGTQKYAPPQGWSLTAFCTHWAICRQTYTDTFLCSRLLPQEIYIRNNGLASAKYDDASHWAHRASTRMRQMYLLLLVCYRKESQQSQSA